MELKEIVESVASGIALCGLIFGLWQYRNAQNWKRMEYAAGLVSKLNSDPDLRLAITLLDWRYGDFGVPERFLPLAVDHERKSFHHTHQALAQAFDLRRRERLSETGDLDLKAENINLENIIYVDVFDRLFEYLSMINSFVQLGLINIEDIELLDYWVRRVSEFTVDGRKIFLEYLKHYEYDGVYDLMRRFGISAL